MSLSRKDVQALTEAMLAMASNSVEFSKGMDAMVKSMADVKKPAKDLSQYTHEWVQDLKESMVMMEGSLDKIKLLGSTMKQFSRLSMFDPNLTQGKAEDELKKIITQMKEMKKAVVDNKQATEAMTAALKETEDQLEEITKSGGDVAKVKDSLAKVEDAGRGLSKAMADINKETEAFLQQDFSRPQSALTSYGKEWGSLFKNIAMGNHLSINGIGAMVKQLGTLRTHARAAAQEMSKDWIRAGKIAANVSKGKISSETATAHFKKMKETGTGIQGWAEGLSAKDKKELFTQLSGPNRGFISGSIDRFAANIADKRTHGDTSGLAGKIGDTGLGGLISEGVGAGGGSVIKGAGNAIGAAIMSNPPVAAAIAIAAVAGGAALMAGKLGADMNIKLQEQLGKGGLAGGRNPLQSFQEMRSGLTPRNDESVLYRMNYEKNTEIMKAMVEHGLGGFNMKGFNADETLTNKKMDLKSGIMRNAYVLGGNLGLNHVEAAKLSLKSVFEFNQSMKSTEDFFVKINLATQAAGISTTHYLGLIDDITGLFSKLNKSLQETTNMLTALGNSGKFTAKDLTDMVDALRGEKKSFAVNAFAWGQSSKEQREAFKQGEEAKAQGAEERMLKGFGNVPGLVKSNGQVDVKAIIDAINATPEGEDKKVKQGLYAEWLEKRRNANVARKIGGQIDFSTYVAHTGGSLSTDLMAQLPLLERFLGRNEQGGAKWEELSDPNSKASQAIMRDTKLSFILERLQMGGMSKILPQLPQISQATHEELTRAREGMKKEDEKGISQPQSKYTLYEREMIKQMEKEAGGDWSKVQGTQSFSAFMLALPSLQKIIQENQTKTAEQTAEAAAKAQQSEVNRAILQSEKWLQQIKVSSAYLAERFGMTNPNSKQEERKVVQKDYSGEKGTLLETNIKTLRSRLGDSKSKETLDAASDVLDAARNGKVVDPAYLENISHWMDQAAKAPGDKAYKKLNTPGEWGNRDNFILDSSQEVLKKADEYHPLTTLGQGPARPALPGLPPPQITAPAPMVPDILRPEGARFPASFGYSEHASPSIKIIANTQMVPGEQMPGTNTKAVSHAGESGQSVDVTAEFSNKMEVSFPIIPWG